MPITSGNSQSPQAIVHYYQDEAGNSQQVTAATPYPIQASAEYNVISTAGTTTVESAPGVFYGVSIIGAGTNSTIQVFDGTQALTAVTTDTALGLLSLGLPNGIGIRYNTSLVVVTGGTAVSTSLILNT